MIIRIINEGFHNVILLENKMQLEKIASKTGLTPEQVDDIVKRINPNHWRWVLNNWYNDSFDPQDSEVQEKIKDAIEEFEQKKERIGTNDIQKFKRIEDLKKEMSRFINLDKDQIILNKKRSIEEIKNMKGVEVVSEKGPYTTINVSDFDTLAELGEGSRSWCTRGTSPECYAPRYISEFGSVNIVFENGAPIIQYSPDYSMITDINNNSLETGSELALLIPPPKQPEYAKDYINNVIEKENENIPDEIKNEIKNNPDLYWHFISNEKQQEILDNPRDPKNRELLLKLKNTSGSEDSLITFKDMASRGDQNFNDYINYFKIIYKTANTPEKALLFYSTNEQYGFLKNIPFLKNMLISKIASNPKTAYEFSRDYSLSYKEKYPINDKGEWTGIFKLKAEKSIASNPFYAEKYATEILKKEWTGPYKKLAEKNIASNPETALEYAEFFEKRWEGPLKELAESRIKRYPSLAIRYAEYVIKDRWPEAEENIAKSSIAATSYATEVLKKEWDGPHAKQAISSIMRSNDTAFKYSSSFGKRLPSEIEDRIAGDLYYSSLYAVEVIKGKWDGPSANKAEKTIMRSLFTSQNYYDEQNIRENILKYINLKNERSEDLESFYKELIKNKKRISPEFFDYVIKTAKTRFPEIESKEFIDEYIATNTKEFSPKYIDYLNFIKERNPKIEEIISGYPELAYQYSKNFLKNKWDGEFSEKAKNSILSNFITTLRYGTDTNSDIEELDDDNYLENNVFNKYNQNDNSYGDLPISSILQYGEKLNKKWKSDKFKNMVLEAIKKRRYYNPRSSFTPSSNSVDMKEYNPFGILPFLNNNDLELDDDSIYKLGNYILNGSYYKVGDKKTEAMEKRSSNIKKLQDYLSRNKNPGAEKAILGNINFFRKYGEDDYDYSILDSSRQELDFIKNIYKGKVSSNKEIKESLKNIIDRNKRVASSNEEHSILSDLEKFYNDELNPPKQKPEQVQSKPEEKVPETPMFKVEKIDDKPKEEVSKKKEEEELVKTNEEVVYMKSKLFKGLKEMAFAKNGLVSNMTVEDVAEKHGIKVEEIERQLELGMKVELEHTSDLDKARDIALDHLVEIPDYYDRLLKMEEEAKEELREAMLILTEEEKAVASEIEEAKSFFGGKKIEGVDTNRFVRLWNMIKGEVKLSLHNFIRLLNPLNWPSAVFMKFYNIIKSIATLATKENQELRLDTQRFLVDIADGKYKGKKAAEMFKDYNEIRKKHGFKPYSYLQEGVIREDFNGVPNIDFEGEVIDESLSEELMLLDENFFKKIGFRSVKMLLGIMPNSALDNILTGTVEKSGVKNVDLSKLKSLKREKKIDLLKTLLDKAAEGSGKVSKEEFAKLEKESEKAIKKAKEESDNSGTVLGNMANDTIKAAGTSIRSAGLAAILSPVISVLIRILGGIPAVAIGAILVIGASEAVKQFN
jgi:hypothetical protein